MQRLISVKEIARRTGLSERSIWRLRDGGALPTPVKFGRLCRWRESDVDSWMAAGCPHCRRSGWSPDGAGVPQGRR